MFSGFQSLFSRKTVDGELAGAVEGFESNLADDYVLINKPSTPHFQPTSDGPITSLPYTLAPRLPVPGNHVPASTGSISVVPEKVDMLTGVPFVLSPHIYYSDTDPGTDRLVGECQRRLQHGILNDLQNWNFNLEMRVMSEFQ